MIKKYTYFGFIEISNTTRQDGCSKVIIVDNFSSKKHILEIHEHVYAVDATDDPIIFILLANSIVSAYEMRSEKVYTVVLDTENSKADWVECNSTTISVSCQEAELRNQFSHWDGFLEPNFKNYYSDNVTDPETNKKHLLLCTSFAAFIVLNGIDKSMVLRIYDSRKSEPRLGSKFELNSLITKVCGGNDHVLLLDSDGSVHTFGSGNRGELGHGVLESVNAPKPIEMFISEQLHIVDIAAGSWHSIVLTDSGDAYGFGWNNNGQLGYPTSDISIVSTPYPFDLQENVTGVCCIHNTTNLTFENSETIIFGSNCSL